MTRWLGVDVGGNRKGFDVALVDDHRLVTLAGRLDHAAVIEIVEQDRPTVVGIDSPRCWAPKGQTCRDGERQVNQLICGIRWTPDWERIHESDYYGWILEGLALWESLANRDIEAIEVFPTASWTRWLGKRGAQTRSKWSRAGLTMLGLDGLPKRTNQDQRDAIAAAVTARQHTHELTETIGNIVVPAGHG